MRETFIKLVEETLLPELKAESKYPYNPIVVHKIPKGWRCIGTGNYAAVFMHPKYNEWVVKVYARDVENIDKEADVYRRLGIHKAYSELIYKGTGYLILKRLRGVTLYEAVHRGIIIPKSVIEDVNEALAYARERGLNPFDVHGKNVMMENGKGYVIDVSDFYKKGEDKKWKDLVKAYYAIYLPFLSRWRFRIPYYVLDAVRHGYRLYRKHKKK